MANKILFITHSCKCIAIWVLIFFVCGCIVHDHDDTLCTPAPVVLLARFSEAHATTKWFARIVMHATQSLSKKLTSESVTNGTASTGSQHLFAFRSSLRTMHMVWTSSRRNLQLCATEHLPKFAKISLDLQAAELLCPVALSWCFSTAASASYCDC